MILKPLAWTAMLALLGCSTPAPEQAENATPAAEVVPTTPAELPPPPPFNPGATDSGANIALVPSPVETQRALEAAGIETQLADLIPSRAMDFTKADVDNAAVRTGVITADMLLTVKTAETAKLVEHLGKIKEGMDQLGGGADIGATIVDIQDRIKGEAITRDELLKELDELVGAIIPELEFNGNDRVVPLIQAGSWLEGANLVAKAVKQSGESSKADSLLKQPAVVNYFIGYIKEEGSDKAPPAVTQKLEASLHVLKGLAEKSDPLTMEDIDQVIQTTNDVLALL
ncbi:MAG: hypothetical protein JXX28_06830 [Deltaproteobacteria bacterium]|nr:hypothetical protein [Deltaproteobacteria bacterium]